MEASGGISKGGGGGACVGGDQVRRLHIIYFLSRMGKIEQPHLIRVHHLHRNGVYLRDVKRWLADLRGKDMPEAFAWSYKRKYKNGYVWQDLMDDDLITPICDNEYVLKGSEISPTSPLDASSFVAIKKDYSGLKSDRKVQAGDEIHEGEEERANNIASQEVEEVGDRGSYQYCPRISTSRKSSPEIYEESPVFSSDGSTSTEESNKQEEQEEEPNNNKDKHSQREGYISASSNFYTMFLGDKANKKKKMTSNYKDGDEGNDNNNVHNNVDKEDAPNSSFLSSSSSLSSHSGLSESKSNSGRTSKIFRNLMNCRMIETNDAVLIPTNNSVKSKNGNEDSNLDARGGGSTRGSWNQRQHQPRRSFESFMGSRKEQQANGRNGNTTRTVPAAYKPVGAPICSQCGKSFRPEKLHTHMKSCRGMKAFAKAASASHRKMEFHDKPVDRLHENHQIVAIS